MLAFSLSLSLSLCHSLKLSSRKRARACLWQPLVLSPPRFPNVAGCVACVSCVLESGQAFVSVVQIVFISAYFNNINWLEYNDTRQQRPSVTHGPLNLNSEYMCRVRACYCPGWCKRNVPYLELSAFAVWPGNFDCQWTANQPITESLSSTLWT